MKRKMGEEDNSCPSQSIHTGGIEQIIGFEAETDYSSVPMDISEDSDSNSSESDTETESNSDSDSNEPEAVKRGDADGSNDRKL